MNRPIDPDERERWQIAFERCDRGTCCGVNATYHRPRCPRRAARLASRGVLLLPDEVKYPRIEARAISEIGGRKGCVWMVAAFALIVPLAMAVSWWVVYW